MAERTIFPNSKYGFLTILEDTGNRKRSGSIIFKCQCDCGNIVFRSAESIMNSVVKGCVISCGCQKKSDIGRRLADDEKRKELARLGLIQIDGTTVASIDRKNMNKNNKSGVRGVCFKSKTQRWQADISLSGKNIGRRSFKNKEDAIAWRKYLEQEYFQPIIEKGRKQNETNDTRQD